MAEARDEPEAQPKNQPSCGCWDDYTAAHATACLAWQERLRAAIKRRVAEDKDPAFREQIELFAEKYPGVLVPPGTPYFDEPQPPYDLPDPRCRCWIEDSERTPAHIEACVGFYQRLGAATRKRMAEDDSFRALVEEVHHAAPGLPVHPGKSYFAEELPR